METSDTVDGEPTPFRNAPIDASGLPQLESIAFEPLDPAYARVRLVSAAVAAALVVVGAVALAAMLSRSFPLVIGGLAIVFIAAVAFAQRLETNHMGYLVREHDLSFCSGVIGRSVATAPYARVQHVSIDRGPIDRRFGLAALQLRTAGGHIAIPGLRHDVAERLKQLVTDRAGALADAEVDDHRVDDHRVDDDQPGDAA